LFAAAPDKRDVSATDLHYPCDAIDAKYGGECYLIQTWRMWEMGLTTERLFEECRKAGQFQTECNQSIGRDLSVDVRAVGPRPARGEGEAGPGGSHGGLRRGGRLRADRHHLGRPLRAALLRRAAGGGRRTILLPARGRLPYPDIRQKPGRDPPRLHDPPD